VAISPFDAVKIQARVVIPIVKALEAEIGAESAHRIVGDAIADAWAAFTASRSQERNTHPATASGFDFPVESEVVETAPDSHAVDMTGCAFADYFRRIGEPEIGALLTCGVDFASERALRPDWEFRRTQTRMQGASHCDFRWRRRGNSG